jgi:hypothetical protein
MRTIWCVHLEPANEMIAPLPKGAVFLAAALYQGSPKAWFEVDTELPLENRTLLLAQTGGELASDAHLAHLATFFMADGNFVFHLFENLSMLSGVKRFKNSQRRPQVDYDPGRGDKRSSEDGKEQTAG